MSEMSRKQFLRDALGWGLGLFAGGTAQRADKRQEPDPALAGLATDFPDALLCEEARRLGLDPAKADRPEMLRAVLAAMRPKASPQEG